VDDNRLFYLAADNDEDTSWLDELTEDVKTRQLPAYRRYQASLHAASASASVGPSGRQSHPPAAE
jgi:hypothetical protein